MNIRLGTKDDVHAKRIGEYIKEIGMMHVHKEPDHIIREVIENENIETYYKSIDGRTQFLIIAEENGELAGFLKVVIKKIEPFLSSKKILYLDQIYVLDKFRRLGVAKLLLEEAETLARRKRITLLKARVYQFNATAQQTFNSSKFKQLYSEYFKVIK